MPAATTTLERTLTVRLPEELHDQLTRLAKATGRTKSFYVVRNLKEQIAADWEELEDIRLGLEEADKGEFAADEEVDAMFAKYAD